MNKLRGGIICADRIVTYHVQTAYKAIHTVPLHPLPPAMLFELP